MKAVLREVKIFFADFSQFLRELSLFIAKVLHTQFIRFEAGKGIIVTKLYKQRGKHATRFVHSSMAGITALGIMVAPVLVKQLDAQGVNPWDAPSPSVVLSASTEDTSISTDFSEQQYRDSIIEYTVQPGDTVSSIAQKFDISTDTIRWQNNLASKDSIKDGQVLQILPVTGVSHKVQKGDTLDSIAKKYDANKQAIVDFPFNTFVNDETFDLAIGQLLIVPDGVKQDEIPWSPVTRVKQTTPDAGTVVASGSFVWPTQGIITQKFYWYHPGVDIANPAAPQVLAADSGKVIAAGWDSTGYGNMVMIDHGNGYRTRYGHMQKLYVVIGQTVKRGSAIGQMGSTGRSTGTHLHFEVYRGASRINPLSVLK
jgi:murein DD-endopeptidase MepM/ murein hydrolase activator NlpD